MLHSPGIRMFQLTVESCPRHAIFKLSKTGNRSFDPSTSKGDDLSLTTNFSLHDIRTYSYTYGVLFWRIAPSPCCLPRDWMRSGHCWWGSGGFALSVTAQKLLGAAWLACCVFLFILVFPHKIHELLLCEWVRRCRTWKVLVHSTSGITETALWSW